MKLLKRSLLLLAFLSLLPSFTAHKFYVGIHQINYASEKKMLQVTSRIFVDDLNDALQKKHGGKFTIGEKTQTPEQISQMEKYLTSHFSVKIDGKPKTLNYLSYDLESNVIICYFNIREIPKFKTLNVSNKILFDFVTEQQNIIQTSVNGQKKSLLLTIDNPQGELQF